MKFGATGPSKIVLGLLFTIVALDQGSLKVSGEEVEKAGIVTENPLKTQAIDMTDHKIKRRSALETGNLLNVGVVEGTKTGKHKKNSNGKESENVPSVKERSKGSSGESESVTGSSVKSEGDTGSTDSKSIVKRIPEELIEEKLSPNVVDTKGKNRIKDGGKSSKSEKEARSQLVSTKNLADTKILNGKGNSNEEKSDTVRELVNGESIKNTGVIENIPLTENAKIAQDLVHIDLQREN